jgi:S1-C subfamily serine protease/mono/diheme cytochrome c family protein
MLGRAGRRWGGAAVVSAVVLVTRLVGAAERPTSAELIFFLQYTGSDYGSAVRDGVVVDAAEYREIVDLSGQILEGYRDLRPHGSARSDLERFRELILTRAPWSAVRSLSRELIPRVVDELDVVPYPADPPDPEVGRELYREDCAPCHGVVGGGDGRAAAGMVPSPSSFRESRMALLSPHQVFNASTFGVPGTAMPAYGDALSPRQLWDVAFFVMTLRDGFDPRPPAEIVPLTLPELAARSDEELLTRLRASRPGAEASELDYYRAKLRPARPADEVDRTEVNENGSEVAEILERTFARVAEKVFASVVGISIYTKDARAEPAASGGAHREGWNVGDAEDRLYPGFHRIRSGSGFLVTGDGDILTCADGLSRPGAAPRSDVIDVELTGNVHCRARVIGIEPTIDLAVLRIEAPVPIRAATIGDSDTVRVGHWAIAVGDPPGPQKSFVPGTIAGRPERECYQEHRTSTLLQSSAAMDPAGFGGPLVNIRGEVVGVTIPGAGSVAAPVGAGSRPVSALPIDLAMTIYRALKVKESEQSPWIGISVAELSAQRRARMKSPPLTGIYIDDVFEPSPASRTGIRTGDVLTKMDDHPILGVSDFQTWLYLLGIDATVTLEIARDGKTLRKTLAIEQRPAAARTR